MKITVYTITDCPFCKQEKEYLTAKSLQFEEKNVQDNRQFLTEMLDVSDKFAGVPFTLVEKDNGEKVGLKGFTQSEFDEALGVQAEAPATAVAEPAANAAMPGMDVPAAPTAPAADVMSAASMPSASMPSIDEAPAMPVAPDMPAPATPAPTMPEMPDVAMASAPAEPVMPAEPVASAAPMESTQVAPAAPVTPAAPVNPQSQLDGLLSDLQSKAQPDLPDFTAAPQSSTPSDPTQQQSA